MTVRCRQVVAIAMAIAMPSNVGLAQSPGASAPSTPTVVGERAARRFPQPVRVGDLPGRKLLGPSVDQPVLGHVTAIVRDADGRVKIAVRLARWFWQRDRVVAIPIEAVALLGEHVALLDLKADTLGGLPDLAPATERDVPSNESIRIGLAKPFH